MYTEKYIYIHIYIWGYARCASNEHGIAAPRISVDFDMKAFGKYCRGAGKKILKLASPYCTRRFSNRAILIICTLPAL